MTDPSPASMSAVQESLMSAGVDEEVLALCDGILQFTASVRPPVCLMADVSSVFVTSSMIFEALRQDREVYVDGVDFVGMARLLREAADKYEAIGDTLVARGVTQ